MNGADRARWKKLGPLGVLAVSMTLYSSLAGANDVLDCVTENKFECSTAGCRDAEEGYVDAERYRLELDTQQLTACLWTVCYSGPASIWTPSETNTYGAWLLRSEPGAESLLLTFKLSPAGHFEATYSSTGEGLSTAFGRCLRPPN